MNCTACSSDIPERAKFCPECGAAQARICSQCNESNAPNAKFCVECGNRLGQTASPKPPVPEPVPLTPPTPADAERRQLTVMFCDLVASTALSSRMDPEDLRDLTRAYQEAASKAIRRHDGYVAQLLGDGILVYFGYPSAKEGDAIRAGRAALDIVEEIRTLNASRSIPGGELSVRIGMHSGLTVVGAMGDAGHTEKLAIGQVPNLAARIQSLAEPNGILVSGLTARLTRAYFDWADARTVELAGIDTPTEVMRLVGVSQGHGTDDAHPDDGPLIGRESELASLRSRWSECLSGAGRVVLVSGEAGIGKSRLIQAFKTDISDETATLTARCSPYYEESALHPLSGMLSEAFGFSAEDEDPQRIAKMEATLPKVGLKPAQTIPLLANILSINLDQAAFPPPMMSPQVKKKATFDAILTLILSMADDRPVLFVVEDLHWIDQSSLDFLSALAERLPTSRVLGVWTCRADFSPPWPVDTNLNLTRLPRDLTEQMIQNVIGDNRISSEVMAMIVERADGNPLFSEELTKMLIETGQLVESGGEYRLVASRDSLDIPPLLQDSLMARLDRLAPAKAIAQVGATIGRRFDYQTVKSVLLMEDEALTRELERLTSAGILYGRGQPPRATYVFKHALLRDAAYSSLLKKTRRDYHQRVAEVLERSDADVPPEVLAHHYTEAHSVEDAIRCWQAAGQAALGGWALPEAMAHLERGLALVTNMPQTPQTISQELSLRLLLGVPLMLTRGFAAPEVESCFSRVQALCEQVPQASTEQLLPALYGLWQFNQVRADYPAAEANARGLRELADRSGDASVRLASQMALGSTLWWRGRVDEAKREFESGLAGYDQETHGHLAFLFGQDPRAFCLAFLTWVHWHDGESDRARERAELALEHCEALKQPGSFGFVELLVATLFCLEGDTEGARRHSEALIALSKQEGMPHWEACGMATLGWSMVASGQAAEGAGAIRGSIQGLLGIGTKTAVTFWQAALTEAELASGRLDEAEEVIEAALTSIEQTDERLYLPELLRLKGEILKARGAERHDEAENQLRLALDLAMQRRSPPMINRARRSLNELTEGS